MKNDKNISEPVALITKRLIPYLTNEELDQLAYRVKMEALSREIYGQGSKLDLSSNPLCPVNADHTVIKYGKNGEKQRYYCKEYQPSYSFQ